MAPPSFIWTAMPPVPSARPGLARSRPATAPGPSHRISSTAPPLRLPTRPAPALTELQWFREQLRHDLLPPRRPGVHSRMWTPAPLPAAPAHRAAPDLPPGEASTTTSSVAVAKPPMYLLETANTELDGLVTGTYRRRLRAGASNPPRASRGPPVLRHSQSAK